MKVVWLKSTTMAAGMQALAQGCLRKAGMNALDVSFVAATPRCLYKVTKTKYAIVPEKKAQFDAVLQKQCPDLIIINDKAALGYITGYLSLALCRGSVYVYQVGDRLVPCIVVDEIRKVKYVNSAMWLLLSDLKKARRWVTGKLREQLAFRYTVVENREQLDEFKQVAESSIAIAIDIETSVNHISCSGYTVLDCNGRVHTWVVPFIDPTKPGGCYWEEMQDEVYAWQTLREVHATNAIKTMQNGSYDSAYFLSYRMPLRNYIGDTMHAFHSLWCELPKRLDFVASIAMDTCQFWKDEGKEDAKEDDNKTRIPKTKAGMVNYWRYNALDCHNTFCSWRFLVANLAHPKLDWALRNYAEEFTQQFGPAFAMTMRGAKYNKMLHFDCISELQEQADAAEFQCRIALDNDNGFNFKSPKQMQWLLYDVFKLTPYKRKGRTTDEKIVKMIKDQNPFAAAFMELLWGYKKPANNVSKYGSNIGRNGRVLYKMCAGVTDTSRYASRGHDFWCGVNIQNVPYVMRPMIEPDKDMVLFDIDYAQSDAYFTAFEMEDEKFIANMLSDDDTHCLHAAHFFKMEYDKLYAAHRLKEDWVSHNVHGVRSITKRIVYGANYLMSAATLLVTMERGPVITAAKQLGYADASSWSDAKLIKLCAAFLGAYFKMYDNLQPSLQAHIEDSASRGGMAYTAWGRARIFFGNLLTDNKIQRNFAAFFGQGGTAGNINRGLHNIYWGHEGKCLEKEGVRLLFQVHDSVVGEVPRTRLDLIPEVQHAMQNGVMIHGRECVVPTEADVGLGWGKRLMPFTNDLTYQQIKTNDENWWRKYNART